MKKFIKNTLIVLIILFSFVFINVKAESLRPVDIHGKLSVNGTDIVDKNNNKYQIKGVSTHGIAWFPQYVNQSTFEYMRDEWGINAIRLAMYSDPNAGYSKDTVNKLKQGVEYAKNAGLYVIIDWHILNDNNPNIYKKEAIEFFKDVSNLYKDYDNVIYEICNEPNGDVKWDRDIKPYAEEVIKEIRNIDNDAIIIVGTPTWSQDVDIASNNPIKGYNNIMYTLHFYAGTHKDNIRNKLKTARNNGLPIFVTEFGMINADGNGSINYDEASKWMNLLDEYNISYMVWALSNKNEGASLIRSDVNKTTGWSYNELAPHGKWFVDNMKRYPKEVVEQKQESNTTQQIVETTTTTTTTKLGEYNTTDVAIDSGERNNKTNNSNNKSTTRTLILTLSGICMGFGIGVLIQKLRKMQNK